MKYQRYDKYKDSGVEWIGEIPEYWEVTKVKFAFKYKIGFTPSTSRDDYYIDGDKDWATISDFNSKKYIAKTKNKITQKAVLELNKLPVPKNSLMYTFKLSIGKIAFAQKDLYTNEAIFSILPSKSSNFNYFYYSLSGFLKNSARENIYGAPILNQDLITNSQIILPPPATQTRIADFLDEKTAKIDALIEKNEKMIKLLEEKLAAMINEAVTKGVTNGYLLDTNVFDKLLEGDLDVSNLRYPLFVTHVQLDEINNIPQTKSAKKEKLLDLVKQINPENLATESAVFDVSKWDQAKFGEGELLEEIKQELSKAEKKDHNRDALIAETAIKNNLTLVTEDKNLLEITLRHGKALTTKDMMKGQTTTYKDSGVEWIGEVPVGWKVSKLVFVSDYQEGPGILAKDFRTSGVPLIRISGVKSDVVSLDGANFLDEDMVKKKWNHFKLKKSDLVISGSASSGLISEVTGDVSGSILYTGLIRFRLKEGLSKDFLKAFLSADVFDHQVDIQKTGSTIKHFGPSHLSNVLITIPSVKEQKKITMKLNSRLNKLKELRKKIRKQIKLLKEHRKSLISHVVTGKIKI